MLEGETVMADDATTPEPRWRRVTGGVAQGVVVAGVGLCALALPVYFLAWYWPALTSGQTCDPVHQARCTPGYGMPQYLTVLVLVAASLLLGILGAVGWRRRGLLLAAGTCAVLAFLVTTVAPAVLHLPQGWYA